MTIEILHQRDSDGGCDLIVFLDGQRVDTYMIDVDPGRGWTREDWEDSKKFVADPDQNLTPEFRAAALAAYDEANGTYIDNDGWIKLDLEISNVYEDGETVVTQAQVWAPDAPEMDDEDELNDWAMDYVYPHTGTGKVEGDAGYFAEVKAVSDDSLPLGGSEHPLVGYTFEFGT